ncbi:cilia- and flagella-associated protein 44 isoform X1 [Tribolium castaneum]|uniref:cilia- and flagella-associated protein 44 isoform X1 n=1 Tax=Tribolium castaneum TaxID=7070 RepID=UPI0030FF2EE2
MSQTDEGLEDLPEDEEEYEEEEEEEEDHWSIYDASTFISGPYQSEKCTINEGVLKFDFSFGYNCRKYFNLTAPDPDTLIFASGNFINFFDVLTKTISFRRSALGGGIAHIKANPNPEFNHVAIAENGKIPLIIIYEWPSMEINCVLKGGSSRLYSHLDFSPDGLLLVSQGGEPDYLITIWNWPKRRILLRTKSYVNDVHRVKFSPYCPGQLTSCGISHIKFWKMARTFTGLKLKGELGRFGKTEFSDILGVLPMPDEKVVSGCSWGNILVWDAGLIKLEVFRTLRRKCHDGPIVQISYNEGELMTVGMDGHVKVWWYEKIDQADPPDDDRVIQIEPTYDFHTEGLMLMCMRKRYPDPKDTSYFGQDGNGGLWIIDLNTEETPKESVQLYKCHAGKVVAIATSPNGPYLASLGEDGRIYVYAYLEKRLIFNYQYPAKGTCMIWVPPKLAIYGDELLMGFDDGTLRLSILTINEDKKEVRVIQTTKPHDKPITQISINPSNSVLVSGGEDSTIFFFQIKFTIHVELVPIGYIRVPNPVTCLTWHCVNPYVILVGCLRGEMVQVEVPKEPQPYTTVSYLLDLEPKTNKFKTYKAQIRRDLKLKEIEERKAEKVAKKRVEMEKLKAENPGLDIDEEVFLADSETEEELEPLYIPEIPNRVIWMQSTQDDVLWLSMGGYDAGYIYEYKIEQKSDVPYFFKMVDEADDTEISSFVYNYNRKYLIFAMENGEIRVNKIKDGDYHDLSDYWSLAMHDNQNGFVPNMCFSYDEKFFFTCGHDGNVFSYTFQPDDDDYIPPEDYPIVEERTSFPNSVPDEANYDKLSLEQASLKKEQDRIDRLAAKHREIYREKLRKLRERFFKLLKRNKKLLPSQMIPVEDLEVDKRVTDYLDYKLEEEQALVKRKLAFDVQKSELRMNKLRNYFIDNLCFIPLIVSGLRSERLVRMLRQRKVSPLNDQMLQIVDEKILEEEVKGRTVREIDKPPERAPPAPKTIQPKKVKEQGLEYFLVNLDPKILESQKHNKLTRLLNKYRDRKLKWERREEEWEEFLARKPLPGVNHPDDDVALKDAKVTIGNYKLKSDITYKASKNQRETTVKKYKELLLSRVKQSNTRHNFNEKVWALREEKIAIRDELQVLNEKLDEIHKEIPDDCRKEAPIVREPEDCEFPERHFEITVTMVMEEEEYDEGSRKEPVIVTESKDFDAIEKHVLPKNTKKFDAKECDVALLDFESLCSFSKNEKKDTLWEHDIRTRRLQRKLFEQDVIIDEMNRKITDFDDKVEKLNTERFQAEVDAKIIDIFMVTVHQELLILKEFEALEYTLQSKVNQKMSEVLDMRDIIDEISSKIVEHNSDIEKAQEKIKSITVSFTNAVQDNKFFDFLRKVFRKKYKPPKVHKDDESSSESSSSSTSSTESDDDGKSIDSRDFGIIKQDLNVCPKGCDPSVYEYTINSRSERHQVELLIKEVLKMIEVLKKDLEIHNKKVKVIEKDLQTCQDELEKYQRQKQDKLNEVRTTVILRLDQMKHLAEEYKTSGIMDTLIFSKERLSYLYKRVEELQIETEHQVSRHRLNVKHYTRMQTDCRYMATRIKYLQEVITDKMKMKFGKVIDINEIEVAMLKRTFGRDDLHDLEEVLLKKIVHDLRLSMMDIKGLYIDQLHFWKEKISQTQKELTYVLRHNTSQQELLTYLVNEKVELAQSLMSQEKKKLHIASVGDITRRYSEEIEKLQAIISEQNQQIQELKDEIKLLRTKGMVLKPKEVKKEEPEEEPVAWEHIKDWGEEIEEEEEESLRKPFSTEIVIPTTLQEKSQEVATELIQEMLEALDVKLTKRSNENFVKEILGSVMRGLSMTELVEELVRNLPIEPDDVQRGIIETTAEQLYVVQEPDAEAEDKFFSCREILEDIVDEILLVKGEPHSVMARLITKLVEQLPIDFLKEQSSLEYIVKRMVTSELETKLNRSDVMSLLRSKEAREILDEIIQTVFDSGLDLLYLIKDE